MIGKFLVWLSIFFGLVLLMIYSSVVLTWAIVLTGALICIGIAKIYGIIKSYRAYNRDKEASQLIGRMTTGIDHKGGLTRRIIW